MCVSIYTHSNNMVVISNRGGAPGHQGAVVLTGGVNHHIRGWTWFCEKKDIKMMFLNQ